MSRKPLKITILLLLIVITNITVFKIFNSASLLAAALQDSVIDLGVKTVICLLLDIALLLLMLKAYNIRLFVTDLYNSRTLIWRLSLNDFKTKYAGSYLGITWAFVQPVVTIVLYWIVFQYGLRVALPTGGVPFAVWLIAGMVPWFFFMDALANATNSMIEYSYLVKKVVFKVSVLPIVKVISALLVHLVFVVFLVILCMIFVGMPTIYAMQFVYYSFCTFCLALAISYATASIVVFFRDLTQIISIILMIGMWATPILWPISYVSEKYLWIFKLNPMFYVVDGFRDSFLYSTWFWHKPIQTIWFWVVCLGCLAIGVAVFRKLKPHFADVL